MVRSSQKAILVTGGTTRVGAVIADELESAGYCVLRSSHRPDARADILADLTTRFGADELFSKATNLSPTKSLFAIVNNAAIFSGDDDALWRLNVFSPIRLTELLAKAHGLVAVNILDSRVLNSTTDNSSYAKTKLALQIATKALAIKHLSRTRVSGVAPGPVLASPLVQEKAGITPFGRPTPEAVARAVRFLIEADFTTGVVIPVDGAQALGKKYESKTSR